MKDPSEVAALNMRRIRNEKGLTQEELSKILGISRVSLANMEVGNQRPTLETIYKFCIALRKDLYEVLPTKEDVLEIEGISGKDKEFILNLLKG